MNNDKDEISELLFLKTSFADSWIKVNKSDMASLQSGIPCLHVVGTSMVIWSRSDGSDLSSVF
jgi:hypothetical protein